jgi:hypothetical protein
MTERITSASHFSRSPSSSTRPSTSASIDSGNLPSLLSRPSGGREGRSWCEVRGGVSESRTRPPARCRKQLAACLRVRAARRAEVLSHPTAPRRRPPRRTLQRAVALEAPHQPLRALGHVADVVVGHKVAQVLGAAGGDQRVALDLGGRPRERGLSGGEVGGLMAGAWMLRRRSVASLLRVAHPGAKSPPRRPAPPAPWHTCRTPPRPSRPRPWPSCPSAGSPGGCRSGRG